MPLHFIGADPIGGPAAVWVDTENGDLVVKGLTADPDDPRVVPFPGTEHLELPGRMKPIILEALDFIRSLGFDPDAG
ncbi:hypothetical protein I2501_38385 [Streptacidiphilus sp. NEAU-YB345]|uniref:Uncharacterized protein n=2 Tax=Streptacidiphilus fuscans TaxID=2789292 RepID=A0A931BCV7_9ACTN|nr:hypothetical protein [Streptacidiphilus fuscans]